MLSWIKLIAKNIKDRFYSNKKMLNEYDTVIATKTLSKSVSKGCIGVIVMIYDTKTELPASKDDLIKYGIDDTVIEQTKPNMLPKDHIYNDPKYKSFDEIANMPNLYDHSDMIILQGGMSIPSGQKIPPAVSKYLAISGTAIYVKSLNTWFPGGGLNSDGGKVVHLYLQQLLMRSFQLE